MKFLACTLLFSLLILSTTYASLPGFNTIMTQNGLNYANSIALQKLQKALSSVTIPDVTGDKDTLSYQITNIVLNSISIPSSSITIDPSIGFAISIAGITGEITANWHFREDIWPHPSGSGTAQIDVSNTQISADLLVGLSAQDHPTVQAQNVGVNIGNLDLHFSGSHLDIILNILKDLFGNLIKNEIEKAITNVVSNEINNELNNELATLNTDVRIGKVATLDLTLVSPAQFSSSGYFLLPQHGEFYAQVNPVEAPFTPAANLPTKPQNNQMLQMYVDEYVPNTASWVFWKAGKMDITITPSMVPPDSPIQFNTSSFKPLIPALFQIYPNMAMQMTITPLNSPTVTFTSSSGADVFGQGGVYVYVLPPGKQPTLAFVLGFNVSADGEAKVVGQNITGSVSNTKVGVWLQSSSIGTFSTSTLSSLVGYLTTSVIVPYFNAYLGVGIPIPIVDGFEIINGNIAFGPGYLYVSTDIQYTAGI